MAARALDHAHLPHSTGAAAPAGVEVTLHDGISPDIDDIAARADQRHHFLRSAWFAASGEAGATTLVARRADGRAVAALPTVPNGPALLGLRAVPGCYWPVRSVPIDADASDAELFALLSSPIAKRALGRAWRLGPVNADDPAVARLRGIADASGWTILERRLATSFILDVGEARKSGPWPRSSTLKKHRYHEKQLASHGALDWRFVSGSGWTAAVFDDLAAIERRSWVGAAEDADAKFLDPARRRIWERAAADPVLAGMMTVGLLYIAGEPVSFSFGLDTGATRYCIATSYDQRFAKHSPGKVLAYRTLIEAADRGFVFTDHGAGDAGYKSTMGAVPGPEIVDLLFVRDNYLVPLLRRFWER